MGTRTKASTSWPRTVAIISSGPARSGAPARGRAGTVGRSAPLGGAYGRTQCL